MTQPAYYPPGHVKGYEEINARLESEFELFAMENSEWVARNVPEGAVIAFQTPDECFSLWARESALKKRDVHGPPPPIVLVHIRELRPPQSRIVRADAELLSS